MKIIELSATFDSENIGVGKSSFNSNPASCYAENTAKLTKLFHLALYLNWFSFCVETSSWNLECIANFII